MTNLKSVLIDDIQFKKISKRLLKLQKEEPDTSLSTIQEHLAKGLGFRNADAAFKFFSSEPLISTVQPIDLAKIGFLDKLTALECTTLFKFCIKQSTATERQIVAFNRLIDATVAALYYIRESRPSSLTQFFPGTNNIKVSGIKEYLNFENNFLFEKYKNLFPDTIHELIAYNSSFKMARFEYEDLIGLLEPQFRYLLQIEQDDVILLDRNWIEIKTVRHTDIKYCRDTISIIEPLMDCKYYRTSWLSQSELIRLLYSTCIKDSQTSTIKVSDLLLLVSRYINTQDMPLYLDLLNIIKTNYPILQECSLVFQNIVKLYREH